MADSLVLRVCSVRDKLGWRNFGVAMLMFCLMATIAGCGVIPEKMSINDPRVKPLLDAASVFHGSEYGFTPLPTVGYVSLETRPRAGYDAMLHISGRTSRTIAFRKTGSGYKWIGEQEVFVGPRKYKSVDGMLNEQVCLTYETAHVSGYPLNQITVTYMGEDPRLADRPNLSLKDVTPELKEWGY
jgi:hypothetical protein